MEWSIIDFGKYRGKSLPQIIFKDADWFFNGYENGYFKGTLACEASELYRRARFSTRMKMDTLMKWSPRRPTKFADERDLS